MALTPEANEAIYADRIAPRLRALEAERTRAVRTLVTALVVGGAAALAAVLVLGAIFDWDGGAIFFTCAMCLGIAVIFGGDPLSKVHAKVKDALNRTVADAVGLSWSPVGDAMFGEVKDYQKLRLLPTYDGARLSDGISGERRGCGIRMCEAELTQRRKSGKNTQNVTVFHGLMLSIAFPRRFLGTTLILRDRGVFNLGKLDGGLARVGLVDQGLEKAFEVYSTDQVEARDLIHPVFMEALIELETAFSGKSLKAAFNEGALQITVGTGALFEPGSMFKPLDDRARVEGVVRDLAAALGIVDAVLDASGAMRDLTGTIAHFPAERQRREEVRQAGLTGQLSISRAPPMTAAARMRAGRSTGPGPRTPSVAASRTST